MAKQKSKSLFSYLKMPKHYDLAMHISVIALMLFGTLMITSTSVGQTYFSDMVVLKTFLKQFIFVVASYFALTIMANWFTMGKAKGYAQFVGYLMLIVMLSCRFFDEVNGSYAWIRMPVPGLGEVTLQPSEFFKVFMVVIVAVTVEATRKKNYDWWTIVKVPVFFLAAGAFLLLFVQKDSGQLMSTLLICLACAMIPSHPNLKKPQRIIALMLMIGVPILLFIMSESGIHFLMNSGILKEYQVSRFIAAADPTEDYLGYGYQLSTALYAFARGGLKGVGLGESGLKMMYLPEATTDYILPIIVEELGIFGFLFIVLLYGVILYRLFYYAFKAKSEGYKVILIGTAMYLSVHFLLNVGGVSGLIPLTGVPLLFISSGSSSLLSVCIAIGISQAVISRIRTAS